MCIQLFNIQSFKQSKYYNLIEFHHFISSFKFQYFFLYLRYKVIVMFACWSLYLCKCPLNMMDCFYIYMIVFTCTVIPLSYFNTNLKDPAQNCLKLIEKMYLHLIQISDWGRINSLITSQEISWKTLINKFWIYSEHKKNYLKPKLSILKRNMMITFNNLMTSFNQLIS